MREKVKVRERGKYVNKTSFSSLFYLVLIRSLLNSSPSLLFLSLKLIQTKLIVSYY